MMKVFQRYSIILIVLIQRYQHCLLDLKEARKAIKAVKQNVYALWHASEELKADREVVMEAVMEYGRALLYASAALQGDCEFMRECQKFCVYLD